jgi:IS30 family transposase
MKKVHLTREQRYTIFAMRRQGCTQTMIAQAIGKDKSVVSREMKRNANSKGKYSYEYAQSMARSTQGAHEKATQTAPMAQKRNHWAYSAGLVSTTNRRQVQIRK